MNSDYRGSCKCRVLVTTRTILKKASFHIYTEDSLQHENQESADDGNPKQKQKMVETLGRPGNIYPHDDARVFPAFAVFGTPYVASISLVDLIDFDAYNCSNIVISWYKITPTVPPPSSF